MEIHLLGVRTGGGESRSGSLVDSRWNRGGHFVGNNSRGFFNEGPPSEVISVCVCGHKSRHFNCQTFFSIVTFYLGVFSLLPPIVAPARSQLANHAVMEVVMLEDTTYHLEIHLRI